MITLINIGEALVLLILHEANHLNPLGRLHMLIFPNVHRWEVVWQYLVVEKGFESTRKKLLRLFKE